MELIVTQYTKFEKRILQSLESNGIKHRSKANSGLWLGVLMGLSAITTILREDSSYSEICLLVGVTGFGLIISCLCLYSCLSMEKVIVKDFQVIYFLPAIITSMLYLLIVNKGLLVSVTWGLAVGSLSTWGVLQLMSCFPSCFTVGEATTVMHGGVLFLISAVTNLPLRYHLPPIHSGDIATALLQVGLLYVILLCLLCGYLPLLHSTKYFYLTTFSLLIFITLPSLYIILDQNPIMWIVYFVFSNTRRIVLVTYWTLCLLLSIFVISSQILSESHATTSARKYFHILAVFVYIPGLILEPILLYLASSMVMGLFMLLELMRLTKVPPLGEFLQQGFSVFVDEKDSLISLTPMYLLCGLSFPLWMPANNLMLLPLFSGILTVGIGDTAASFVGHKWGKHKWSGTDKSIEGTIACILSQYALIAAFICTGYLTDHWFIFRSLLAVVIVSVIEARTNQVDNLALPLLMYLCLIV